MAVFSEPFNLTRLNAIQSFTEILEEFFGKEDITEKQFCNTWMDRLSENPTIIADGWYQPPPRGATVLTATSQDPGRISFSTLREKIYQPSEKSINWKEGLLFVYCSPISIQEKIPGDFALTLYFGKDQRLRKHFLESHRAVQELLLDIHSSDSPNSIFSKSQAIFEKYELQNSVISITDSTPLDLGHTFPSLTAGKLEKNLTEEQCNQIRNGRCFLNGHSEWDMREGLQFTIEPQLRNRSDHFLPQVTFHYLLRKSQEKIEIQTDIDKILQKYGLLSS